MTLSPEYFWPTRCSLQQLWLIQPFLVLLPQTQKICSIAHLRKKCKTIKKLLKLSTAEREVIEKDVANQVVKKGKEPVLLDDVINEMINTDKTVIADIWVSKEENCFPMIQSGSAHNEMVLSKDQKQDKLSAEKGKILV